jgi:thiazole synthase ThiGH ThiG subunit
LGIVLIRLARYIWVKKENQNMIQDTLTLGAVEAKSRLLHCFGSPTKSIEDPNQAVQVIQQSGTDFITLYTHGDIGGFKTQADFPIGYGGLTFSDIQQKMDTSNHKILVNTDRAFSVREAVTNAMLGAEISGSNLIKLEVLEPTGRRPINDDVVTAAQQLIKEGLTVLPLMNNDTGSVTTAKKLQHMGCVCVRALLSDIGSKGGLKNPKSFERLCKSIDIPVIAEGGVNVPQDAYNAMTLGAGGVLVNKAMFCYSDPVKLIQTMRDSVHAGRQAYNCNLERTD